MAFVYLPVGYAIGGLGTFLVLVMVRYILNLQFLGRCGSSVCNPVFSYFIIVHTAFWLPHVHILFVQDTAFSAVVTALFLRPIYKILREGGVGVHRSDGYKSLMKTKWMTLSGAGLAVLSSTALYVNALMVMALGKDGNQWYASPYLNFAVFGINLDSVLNDLGMLLACGVLKTVSCTSLSQRFTTAAPPKVRPEVQPVFDSQAYERDKAAHIPPLSLGSSGGSWVSSVEKHIDSEEHLARKCSALRPPMQDSKKQNESSTDLPDTEKVETKVQKMPL
jgi:hypothetical protein